MNKRCCVCGEDRPISEFFRHSGTRDGLQGRCKECHLAKCRKHRAELSGRPVPDRVKACSACREVKPYSAFRRSASNPNGFSGTCSACLCARDNQRGRLSVRSLITSPNLLDVCDRSERRADLAEIGGLKGVHEIRSRLAVVRAARERNRGMELTEEMLAELLPA